MSNPGDTTVGEAFQKVVDLLMRIADTLERIEENLAADDDVEDVLDAFSNADAKTDV